MSGPPQNEALLRVFPPPMRSARFSWSWYATDDKGVTGFKAQLRSGDAKWRTVSKFSRPVSGNWQLAPITIPTGAFELRVRARDATGKTSPWAAREMHLSYRNIPLDDSRASGDR